jgi:hypothetical protein
MVGRLPARHIARAQTACDQFGLQRHGQAHRPREARKAKSQIPARRRHRRGLARHDAGCSGRSGLGGGGPGQRLPL